MVDTCEQELGQIDILVTNAIASVRNTLLETKFEDLQRTLEIGVYGVFHVCQIVARRMVLSDGPRLDYPYLIPARPFSL
jgi:NAD(P)-dependent dehydrogenase (short-subunit alcohol dehydrogenase family)